VNAKLKPAVQLFYIAFSIHGTDCFISASIEVPTHVFTIKAKGEIEYLVNGRLFTAGQSRRPSYNPTTDGIKLLSKELLNVKGEPTTDAKQVWDFFQLLKAEGWTLKGYEEFFDYHDLNDEDAPATAFSLKSASKPSTTPEVGATGVHDYLKVLSQYRLNVHNEFKVSQDSKSPLPKPRWQVQVWQGSEIIAGYVATGSTLEIAVRKWLKLNTAKDVKKIATPKK
jgi:hypothetical protein